jgi:hypothetical protein
VLLRFSVAQIDPRDGHDENRNETQLVTPATIV